jgi:hypothetical protein
MFKVGVVPSCTIIASGLRRVDCELVEAGVASGAVILGVLALVA